MNDDLVPQPIFDEENTASETEEISSGFVKKMLAFMGVELIIAAVALSFILKLGPFSPSTIAAAPVASYTPSMKVENTQNVLGTETSQNTGPKIIYQVVTPSPTPTLILKKKPYKIVLFGDSMEDTMGETGEYLQKSLKAKYPDNDFLIYNYGESNTTIKDGIERFDQEFKYGIRKYQSIPDLKPDLIIIGSFAYTPPDPFDRDFSWLTLTQLVQKAQKVTPNVYLMAEVAPLRGAYGRGPSGLNWEESYAKVYSGHIIDLLDNAVGLSNTLHVPLIDAYTPSLVKNSSPKEGDKKYISVADGIHPSFEGETMMADLIAEKLKFQ